MADPSTTAGARPGGLSLAAALAAGTAAALLAAGASVLAAGGAQDGGQDAVRFRGAVDLVHVTATVSDARGRFVAGLEREDFTLYEDGRPQPLVDFSAERVPVSLGIVVDTSGSMAGDKWRSAREALDRFLFDLLDPADEVFLYTFGARPQLVQAWTTDREHVREALRRVEPVGSTALLDAVAEAVPLAQTGRHRKKAVLVISDGQDTGSETSLPALHEIIRQSEVLVYAIGIDGEAPDLTRPRGPIERWPTPPIAIPRPRDPWLPRPGLPGPTFRDQRFPFPPPAGPPTAPWTGSARSDDGVDLRTLRDVTDDSGGRTELIRSVGDLAPATSRIADELSRQYYLAYVAAAPRDGRWHEIRVETRDPRLTVRARRGYMAESGR